MARNVLNFLALIISKEGQLNLNWDDDLVKEAASPTMAK